jgi:TolA-binding protein
MVKKVIYLLLFIVLISSCRTVEKGRTERHLLSGASFDENSLRKRIKEWEDYMQLIRHKDLSLDTVLRLTEGYLEAKDMFYKRELDEYENALHDSDKGNVKREIKQPRQDYRSLISQFKILMDRYRYGKGADAIHYILGYAIYEQGERDEAIAIFEGLVKNYPQSIYFPEVNFRLGEFYFETEQYGEAREAYGRILNFPQSVFYYKAMYKLGWVYYKLDDFKNASDLFMAIIDRSWEGEFKEGGLLEESISCFVMSLHRFNSTDDIISYLKSKGLRGFTLLVFNKLGELYAQETRYENAISVYKAMLEISPEDINNPYIYMNIADLYDYIGDRKSSLDAREQLISQHNPMTVWYGKNYPNGDAKLDNLISKEMIYVSKAYHLSGKEANNIGHIKNAIDGYNNFLFFFPKSQNYKDVSLLLAEALFDSGMYRDAALAYERASILYNEPSRRGEIAYSAILTYEILFNNPEEDKKVVIENAVRVLDANGKDFSSIGRLERTIYTVSDMYARLNIFNKAREVIMPLTKGKDAVVAYKRIAELYLAEDNLIASEDVYSRLLSISKDIEIQETLAKLRYKIGEEHLKTGRLDEAAKKFEQSFASYPSSAVGESALIKLGIINIQKKNIDAIRGIVERILKNHPNSDGAISLLIEAGRKLENDEPLKAAALYEEASSITSDSINYQKLIFAAVAIYEKNIKYGKAAELCERSLSDGKMPSDKELELRYRLGYFQIMLGKKEDGVKNLNWLIEKGREINDIFAARAELIIIKERLNAYLAMRLTQPFEDTLKKKTEDLNGIIKDYSSLAGYKAAEILPEMFFSMGVAIENFRDSILQSERPEGLTKEEMEEYNFLLEEKAYPYDEKAVKMYEECLKVGREYKLYNELIQNGINRLASLRPALYKREFAFKEAMPVFIYPEAVMIEAEHEGQKYSMQ